jgi:biopolymer transport protein ExbD
LKHIFIYIFIFFSTAVNAQNITMRINKPSISIGEEARITISGISADCKTTVAMPGQDSTTHIETLKLEEPVFSKANNNCAYTQEIVITSFDSGLWKIEPAMYLPGSKADPIMLTVNPVDISKMQDYHDIKDIQDVPAPPQLKFIIALVLLTILALLALYIINKKLRLAPAAETAKTYGPPALQAYYKKLDELKASWQNNNITAKQLGVELTKTLKQFLSGYNHRIETYTDEEVILQADKLLEKENFKTLAQSIRMCSAMKFAKYCPAINDGCAAIDNFKMAIGSFEKHYYNQSFQPQK